MQADGSWADPTGAQATTHIIKPGVEEFKLQALNEHVCLDAANRLGLDAASSRYVEFDGQPAIVVTRYDRRRRAGVVDRIHQEDMCQALSRYPQDKYESEGGPSAVEIVKLLKAVGMPSERSRNIERFTDALIYNYLIGAPDAHAKNYSLMLDRHRVQLAPLYDVASGLPYDHKKGSGLSKAAMSVGGKREFGYVLEKHWVRFANDAGLDPDLVVAAVARIGRDLPDALGDALDAPDVRPLVGELRSRLLDRVAHLCAVSAPRVPPPSAARTRAKPLQPPAP